VCRQEIARETDTYQDAPVCSPSQGNLQVTSGIRLLSLLLSSRLRETFLLTPGSRFLFSQRCHLVLRYYSWRSVDPRIGITLKIIDEQKSSIQFSLTQTSLTLGLSEAYLLRLFHQEVGKTFRRHLRDERMLRAADLVQTNTRSIKQIALDCGYTDVCNFYRDFRTVHEITPRQLRLGKMSASASITPTADN
jgi:AraC-like DNA-binding protein